MTSVTLPIASWKRTSDALDEWFSGGFLASGSELAGLELPRTKGNNRLRTQKFQIFHNELGAGDLGTRDRYVGCSPDRSREAVTRF
jgi:hypothetical protein